MRTGFYMQTNENVEGIWHLFLGRSSAYLRWGPIYDGLITDHTGKYDIARCLTSDQRYMDCCQISIVYDVPVVPYLNHRVL